jgi:hypothetical protein
MSDTQIRQLLDHALRVARQVDARVLVGVLRQDTHSASDAIRQTCRWLCERAAMDDVQQAMIAQHVCGFTVCPPTGEGWTSAQLRSPLQDILRLNLPTALYQLPQVTKNEMEPALVAELAAEFPNFFLFKDTSGADRVATSRADLLDVFLVRGAEGQYARWLKPAGGPYDGFLLSTANVFADRYARMIECVERQDALAAQQAVASVEWVVTQVFGLVAPLSCGNSFTNANKAIDHFMAHGASADLNSPPHLYDGQTLPSEILGTVRTMLDASDLLPTAGYLGRQ